jgi:diadenosine tetraphosphate (Ap4A) HIT family hydrolase
MMNEECPFCKPSESQVWRENADGLVLHDGFPVSEGHSLVVPRRHVASLFELSPQVQSALWMLVSEVRQHLAEQLNPDGFNIGVNDGVAAGQTVMHAHIHVIPRWNEDVADPRGGIRGIIPDKARYWGDE